MSGGFLKFEGLGISADANGEPAIYALVIIVLAVISLAAFLGWHWRK